MIELTFLKVSKRKSYGVEAIDFHDKEMPKVGSDYTCLAVILMILLLKNMETIIHRCF